MPRAPLSLRIFPVTSTLRYLTSKMRLILTLFSHPILSSILPDLSFVLPKTILSTSTFLILSSLHPYFTFYSNSHLREAILHNSHLAYIIFRS